MIRLSSAYHLPEYIRAHGGAPERVLAAAGLVPADVDAPDRWLAAEQLADLFEAASAELDDPWFGIHLGLEAPIEDFGLIAYVILNAPLVRTAMENLERYAKEHSFGPIEAPRLEVKGDVAEIGFVTPPALAGRVRQLLEFHFASIVRTIQRLVGDDSVVKEVRLQHPNVVGRSAVCPYLDIEIGFGYGVSTVRFEASAMNLPVVGADRSQLPIVRTRLGDLESASGRDLPTQVGAELAEMLCDGAPGVGEVARKLAISARSLQRRLAEHGTSFREVLGRVRIELAEEYLAGSDLQVAEIAGLLGYSEPNSFTNAFRAERGVSPTEWRKRRRDRLKTSARMAPAGQSKLGVKS